MGDDRPLLVVVGNCQAESYRLLLDAGDLRTQRIPALHELTPADVPPLLELLSRTDFLVSQPTVDDYRGLPVGTRQLHAVLPLGARTAAAGLRASDIKAGCGKCAACSTLSRYEEAPALAA